MVNEGDPVVGGCIVRDDDVEVIVRTFVGSAWLFKLSSVCDEVSVLIC